MKSQKLLKLLLTALSLTALCACRGSGTPPLDDTSVSEAGIFDSILAKPQPEEPIYLRYPGFTDQFFHQEQHQLTLFNEEAAVCFRFTLTDEEGDLLFTSDPVPPGESILWDAAQHWSEPGCYLLTIRSTPLLPNGEEGNSLSQTIKIYLDR